MVVIGRRVWLLLFLAGFLLPLHTGCAAQASGYPSKPITLIVPFAAGSGTDATFRVLAQEAEKELGQKVVVVNRPGAGSTLGVGEVALATPDGYTIGMAGMAPLTILPHLQDVPYRGPQDFTFIAQADVAPMALYVSAASPFRTLADFVAAARERPGQLAVGMSGGAHTTTHVELAVLERAAGVRVAEIPYDAAQHVPAVLGGSLDAAVGQVALIAQHVRAGTLRALCVFGTNGRAVSLPDVPTSSELGYAVPDVPYESVIAPKGVAREVLDKLVPAFKKAVESQAFAEYGARTGLVPAYLSPTELNGKLSSDATRLKLLIDELGWAKNGQKP